MLHHPTIQKLYELRLTGMAEALEEQQNHHKIEELSFEERLGLLVDHEKVQRDNRRLKTRLRRASLKQTACVEDIDFKMPRSLDKALILSLADCNWVHKHQNILITGPTGCGKSFIGCALGHKACLEGFTTKYWRFSRLLEAMNTARCDGTYAKMLKQMAKVNVLVIDDWGLSQLDDTSRRDILEIFEDRYKLRSTIVTSQFPVKKWHEYLGDPTLADAILDRLVHNAFRIDLKARESIRKYMGTKEMRAKKKKK